MTRRTAIEQSQSDLVWLIDVLGGPVEGSSTIYRCRPSVAEPQFLIPLDSGAVTAAALDRSNDGRSTAGRVVSTLAMAGARTGLAARLATSELVSLPPTKLLTMLQVELGEPTLIAAITIGPRRRNRKPVLQLIKPDGEVVGFAKVGSSALTRHLVSNEARWLQAVESELAPHIKVPRVLYQSSGPVEIVVTTAVDTTHRRRRRGPLSPSVVAAIAVAVPAGRKRVDELSILDEWRRADRNRALPLDALLARHGTATVEAGLWHGDLTPWNTATSRTGISIWDWEFAGDGRPVGFDLLHARFEEVRRAAPGNERAGLEAAIADAPRLLASVGQSAATDAVVELYLCELIARERLLDEGGERPVDLGPLDEPAALLLAERLDRPIG